MNHTASTPPPMPSEFPGEPSTGSFPPFTLIETLLKRPTEIIHHLEANKGASLASAWLLGFALLFAALYGVVVGSFSGEAQLWIAPAKIALGTLLSMLICLPSLYIFTCLSGAEAGIRTVAGVFFAALCLMGLLLIGFAPVAWVFSQSTDNVAFMGALHLMFWIIGTYFGLRLFKIMGRLLRVPNTGHLRVWALIFVLVSLQMMTALRPILGKSPTFLPHGKKFFAAHWIETMNGSATER